MSENILDVSVLKSSDQDLSKLKLGLKETIKKVVGIDDTDFMVE